MWLLKELGIEDINIRNMDLLQEENKEEWFLKINSRHCVPCLDDNGFILRESRSIMRYLCESTPGGEQFYPKDLQLRAVVDQGLDEDAGFYSKVVAMFTHPRLFMRCDPPPSDLQQLHNQLKELDTILEGKQYLANQTFSIADISTMADLTMLELFNFDFSPYKNVETWMKHLKTRPCYSVNEAGLQIWRDLLTSEKLRAIQDKNIERMKTH